MVFQDIFRVMFNLALQTSRDADILCNEIIDLIKTGVNFVEFNGKLLKLLIYVRNVTADVFLVCI